MAQYTVLERSCINNALVEAGDIVDYDGEPGPNLELVVKPDSPSAPAKSQPKAEG